MQARAVVWLGCLALLVLTGCARTAAVAPVVRVTHPAGSLAASAPVDSGLVAAPSGESPAHAARRLFPVARRDVLSGGDIGHASLIRGTRPGFPVPVSAEVEPDILAQWVQGDDLSTAAGGLFADMQPGAMSTSTFLVPMVKSGRSVFEFSVYVDDAGRWEYGGGLPSLPGGALYDLEAATVKLKKVLGPATVVRPAVFLPSGLEFAVGNNEGHEAAVYLACVVGAEFNNTLPQDGMLFTPSQLKVLLTQ